MRCVGIIDDYLTDLDAADRAVIDRVYAIATEEVPDAEQGKGMGCRRSCSPESLCSR